MNIEKYLPYTNFTYLKMEEYIEAGLPENEGNLPYNCGQFDDFLQTEIFRFCGCGCLEENLIYIAKGLRHISKKISTELQWQVWKAQENELFGNESAAYFFYYWADLEGLTEHGFCVPGWLTEKGKMIMDDIFEYFKLEE